MSSVSTRLYFFQFQRKFFNFLFDILEWYKFGLCITAWKQGFGFWLCFYLSKRVSLCSRHAFLLTFNYFVPFGVIENRFTKINFKYFNGNCDYSSCPGWWILFLYAPPHKGLAFWKNYLWTNLSFSYSLKITYILLRQVISLKKMVVLSVNFTILILWSPVSFNPFISINEIGKYHSHNIV